jgi:hypothetical protein
VTNDTSLHCCFITGLLLLTSDHYNGHMLPNKGILHDYRSAADSFFHHKLLGERPSDALLLSVAYDLLTTDYQMHSFHSYSQRASCGRACRCPWWRLLREGCMSQVRGRAPRGPTSPALLRPHPSSSGSPSRSGWKSRWAYGSLLVARRQREARRIHRVRSQLFLMEKKSEIDMWID